MGPKADPKIELGGKNIGRKPAENLKQLRKPTETQGPCPDIRGFCIKALTVITQRPKKVVPMVAHLDFETSR